ncbi:MULTISPECIES: sensor histidine kinase [unclassified Curtobacterium]|uniref:sensor histidine kinase n=1 Tax=unclassified Curtobacterium TaxID=257496 RepID=UPI0021ABCC41|nr:MULTISPECIES: histidine kinase [unclassified Curtobacterium]
MLVDLLVVAASAMVSFTFLPYDQNPMQIAAAVVACAGLLVSRRLPWLSLAVALPAFLSGAALVPIMVAQFQIGLTRSKRWHSYAVSASVAVAYMVTAGIYNPQGFIDTLVLAVVYTAMPTLLGAFLRERRLVVSQLHALQDAQALGQRQAAEMALARERAVLAREMHDVVSHQVSLIAVQAGALQLASDDPLSRDVARVIRGLSTATLDELRSMVGVLRHAGDVGGAIAPQPTLDDIAALITASGIDVTVAIDLPSSLGPAVQRAVYRTVQEGLTNARKHATGASVAVFGRLEAGKVILDVDSGIATKPLLHLPSGGYGLTGLRERAQLLDGTVTNSILPDGSHRLRLQIPL